MNDNTKKNIKALNTIRITSTSTIENLKQTMLIGTESSKPFFDASRHLTKIEIPAIRDLNAAIQCSIIFDYSRQANEALLDFSNTIKPYKQDIINALKLARDPFYSIEAVTHESKAEALALQDIKATIQSPIIFDYSRQANEALLDFSNSIKPYGQDITNALKLAKDPFYSTEAIKHQSKAETLALQGIRAAIQSPYSRQANEALLNFSNTIKPYGQDIINAFKLAKDTLYSIETLKRLSKALLGSSNAIESYGKSIINACNLLRDTFYSVESLRRQILAETAAIFEVRTAILHQTGGGKLVADDIEKSFNLEYKCLELVLKADLHFSSPYLVSKNNNSSISNFQRIYIRDMESNGNNFESGSNWRSWAYNQLYNIELELRNFIEYNMSRNFGPNWVKSRIPEEMKNRWDCKKNKSPAEDQTEHRLIDYADFTDYCNIILRKDNWNEVFKATFHRRELVQESLQRLYPIRNCIMHARPIYGEDCLYLCAEIHRLRKTIGV